MMQAASFEHHLQLCDIVRLCNCVDGRKVSGLTVQTYGNDRLVRSQLLTLDFLIEIICLGINVHVDRVAPNRAIVSDV